MPKLLIIDCVRNHNGCKLTELPVFLYEDGWRPGAPEDLMDEIDELVESGELVAVNYVLPDMKYREKTFLLPKGSQVNGIDDDGEAWRAGESLMAGVIYVRATGSIPENARRFGPKQVLDASSEPCPACGKHFVLGDYTTLVSLGPGDDEEARAKCRDGRYYNAVALEVHWACAGGEES